MSLSCRVKRSQGSNYTIESRPKPERPLIHDKHHLSREYSIISTLKQKNSTILAICTLWERISCRWNQIKCSIDIPFHALIIIKTGLSMTETHEVHNLDEKELLIIFAVSEAHFKCTAPT